jgi:DNA-binding transcriptional ArsR family regulator
MSDAALLDQVFWALSDSTRRSVIERLTQGPASVTELAQPHAMSLPGFTKHLRVLEEAGLVVRAKEGRTVRCELAPRALEDAAMWLAHYEKFWSAQLDALGRYLYHQEEVQPWTSRSAKNRSSALPVSTRSPPKKSGGRGPIGKR